MNKVKTYKSDAFAAIHDTMSGMYDAGVIDKKTMREFDEACLTPVHTFSATDIKALREREEVSQRVFALYMNVSKDSVTQWERGIKKPRWPNAETPFSCEAESALGDHLIADGFVCFRKTVIPESSEFHPCFIIVNICHKLPIRYPL